MGNQVFKYQSPWETFRLPQSMLSFVCVTYMCLCRCMRRPGKPGVFLCPSPSFTEPRAYWFGTISWPMSFRYSPVSISPELPHLVFDVCPGIWTQALMLEQLALCWWIHFPIPVLSLNTRPLQDCTSVDTNERLIKSNLRNQPASHFQH